MSGIGGEKMTRQLITAKEAATLLGVSQPTAREWMRQINAELKKAGYITIERPIKVPRKLLCERFGLECE